jgi:hypothetical protein
MSTDNTNRGTIAKNTRKTDDKHPDIAGTINVEGKEFWLNGWLKTNGSDGSKFYSLSLKPKEARAASYPKDKASRNIDPADDDQPF